MKVPITSARVRVVMRWYRQGSVLKQTIESGCAGVEIHLDVDSPAPADRVAAVVRCAHRGCYVENLITRPVRLVSHVAVNGAALEIDDYPAPA